MPAVATGIFVYGTLMPGEPRWPALRPFSAGWARATARGRLWDTGRGYPAARFHPTGAPIPGVLVSVSPERLGDAYAVLDGIEDEGVLYRRLAVPTSGGPALGYEWLGATEGLVLLPNGWRVSG
jgi:gamma-glutamylcyclotransferase (GGCT)/AIG2-like uncharacterized protein YtfP